MLLAFMRHGEAEILTAGSIVSDSERSLTDFGRKQVSESVSQMIEQGISPGLIASSPYKRARQTSAIVREVLGCPEMLICDQITPSGQPLVAVNALSRLIDVNQVEEDGVFIAVMHQPIISRLIELLSNERQSMGTADIAVLDVPNPTLNLVPGGCELKCVIRP